MVDEQVTGNGRSLLLVGGTGPTGPCIIEGALERGYRVSIFHSGQHEIPMPDEVEHIHGDPHFPETIAEALWGRTFDVVLAQYGRLRHLVDFLADRTSHIVAIGGMTGPVLRPDHPHWGPLGRPAVLREEDRALIEDPDDENRLGLKIAQASRHLFDTCAAQNVKATYIVYPPLYGPRQPGSPEWAIVRRARDGRPAMLLPDGGLRIETRAYVHNVSQAPLLAIDNPDTAAGKTYAVTDREIYSTRQRLETLLQHLGADPELVSMPYELATPAHPWYRLGADHRAGMGDLIRNELGYEDRYPVADALAATADWLLANPDRVPEIETQLKDPFDYAFEDRLIEWWRSVVEAAPRPDAEFSFSHMYRHPTAPGQGWKPSH